MSALAHAFRRTPHSMDDPAVRAAIADMSYELIPLLNLAAQIPHLPENARLSITASPVRTLEETLDLCAELRELGYRPVPHIAARMVEDAAHVGRLAARCKEIGLTEIFCIGGDAEVPGAYADAMSFLRPFLDLAAGDITAVGVAGYPDGHAFVDTHSLHTALIEKQELFAAAGVVGHASTQMCFSTATIRRWLEHERAAGFELPIHLGVPGVVDRTKLMTMGMRLGVGASLRYLKKNRASVLRLFASSGYNPSTLIDPLARDFDRLGIEGLHCFTFNQVEATRAWQHDVLASHRGATAPT